jgi:8-oxo-dGTP diphosphatase
VFKINKQNCSNVLDAYSTPLEVGDYHIVVHVWIMNKEGKVLLTKRHADKPHPNLWECPGGSILAGESSLEGAIREVKEEIGIELLSFNGKLINSDRRDVFHNFCDVWLFNQIFELKEAILQKDEVSDIKWVTKSELKSMYHSNCVVPTLSYFNLIFQ